MATISTFDIFKVGIGPSSSHTMGPWRAGLHFLQNLSSVHSVTRVQVDLFGSLAKTGKGHGTDYGVVMGLAGYDPSTCQADEFQTIVQNVWQQHQIQLDRRHRIPFQPSQDILFHYHRTLPYHPNGIRLTAYDSADNITTETYYSVGGGFIEREGEVTGLSTGTRIPYEFGTAEQLLSHCHAQNLKISEIVRANEVTLRDAGEVRSRLHQIWDVMLKCIHRGCHTEGVLPGALGVIRRSGSINRKLLGDRDPPDVDPESWMNAIRSSGSGFAKVSLWVSCFALAVNEENAAFGRVVTAPTNGAAGVIPSVLMYHQLFCGTSSAEHVETFLLTAGAVGSLFKTGATISAAMGGCQAEIGVSSAMAAAGLTECLGGTPEQCLMAAEIAMEHHLGLTCDPVGGLVQIPCIERNTMGAIKAITASQLALNSDPDQAKVSLDAVIRTMWETARDMGSKYKETAEGGLALQIAVNLPEC